MAYCFMNIEKIKTSGALMSKYRHNYRLVNVENADRNLNHKNEELIKLPVRDGEQLSPHDVFKERIASLAYYKDHNIRSNAVHALEIVTTFTKDPFVDIEKWKQKNVEWIKNTFNVAGDGKDNVISMVYHGDEAGNVHCHALVIPIDERGHLNASRFLDGSRQMSKLQTKYANYMKSFGLKRGLQGSQAKHKDIKKFYAELNQAMEERLQQRSGESIEDYMNRSIEHIKTMHAASLREIKEAEREQLHNVNERYQECRENIERDFKDYNKIRDEITELKQIKQDLQDDINTFNLQLEQMQDELDEKEAKSKKYDSFLTHLAIFQKDYPEQAEAFQREIDYVAYYGEPDQKKELQFENER